MSPMLDRATSLCVNKNERAARIVPIWLNCEITVFIPPGRQENPAIFILHVDWQFEGNRGHSGRLGNVPPGSRFGYALQSELSINSARIHTIACHFGGIGNDGPVQAPANSLHLLCNFPHIDDSLRDSAAPGTIALNW